MLSIFSYIKCICLVFNLFYIIFYLKVINIKNLTWDFNPLLILNVIENLLVQCKHLVYIIQLIFVL